MPIPPEVLENDTTFNTWIRSMPWAANPPPTLQKPGGLDRPGHQFVEYTCSSDHCMWGFRHVLWDDVPRERVKDMLEAHVALHDAGPFGTAAPVYMRPMPPSLDRVKIHVLDTEAKPACGTDVTLDLRDATLAADAPSIRRCHKPACKKRWPE